VLTLVLGGARSGKSRYAAELAGDGPVLFIATARRDHDDLEMMRRIERHRAYRAPAWSTVEEPLDPASVVERTTPGDRILLDCVTLWMANIMWECRSLGAAVIEAHAQRSVRAFIESTAQRNVIVVSNDVGAGLVPLDPVGRRFRDIQGCANQELAAAADRAVWMVAGIPIDVKRLQA
jgi:adenosylcobinamide kinase/adenosylcobinamide-phosphate guanylyltransferase